MDSIKQPCQVVCKFSLEKTTTCDEEKRYRLIQKLTSQNPQSFRELDINEFDLNITENFEELQYIDDALTPLIYCAHYGLKEIIKFLLRNTNVDVDMETAINQQTPLLVACLAGNYQIVRLLLLANAEVNKPNAMNQHPLTVVLFRLIQEPPSFENKRICFRIAEMLTKHGADPNWIIDKAKGYSLLHYFCASKSKFTQAQKDTNLEVIKFLIANGADPFQRSLQDKQPQDLIEKHCNREKLETLFSNIRRQKYQKPQKKVQDQHSWIGLSHKNGHFGTQSAS